MASAKMQSLAGTSQQGDAAVTVAVAIGVTSEQKWPQLPLGTLTVLSPKLPYKLSLGAVAVDAAAVVVVAVPAAVAIGSSVGKTSEQ